MKYEELRSKECSRDHCGNRGLVAHDGLVRFLIIDCGKTFKCMCVGAPDVGGV